MTTAVEETVKEDLLSVEEIQTRQTEDQVYGERHRRARARARAVRGFYIHFAIYLTVCAFLFAINMVTSRDSIWFFWPVLGWGIFVAMQGLGTFGHFTIFGPEWEERKIREYMEKDA